METNGMTHCCNDASVYQMVRPTYNSIIFSLHLSTMTLERLKKEKNQYLTIIVLDHHLYGSFIVTLHISVTLSKSESESICKFTQQTQTYSIFRRLALKFCKDSFRYNYQTGWKSAELLWTKINRNNIGIITPRVLGPLHILLAKKAAFTSAALFFDTQSEVRNRQTAFIDKDTGDGLDQQIVRGLIQMLDHYSPVAKAFRMMASMRKYLITTTQGHEKQRKDIAVEEKQLKWTRNNQDTLWVDLYHNLCNAVTRGNTNAVGLGKRIVLPRTFTESPRYMMQNYQDAMALCRAYDNPDLFITFTSNPKWPEIAKMNKKPGGIKEERGIVRKLTPAFQRDVRERDNQRRDKGNVTMNEDLLSGLCNIMEMYRTANPGMTVRSRPWPRGVARKEIRNDRAKWAHDFESHDDITEEPWQGNFESWVQDPLHVRPIAHAIWDPHFCQPVVEAFQVSVAERYVNRGRFLVTRPGDIRSENADYTPQPRPLERKRWLKVFIECDYMLHGPCGKDARYAACTIDGKCSKHFLKAFLPETFLDEEMYPHYRRRDNKVTVKKGSSLNYPPLSPKSTIPGCQWAEVKQFQLLKVVLNNLQKGIWRTTRMFHKTYVIILIAEAEARSGYSNRDRYDIYYRVDACPLHVKCEGTGYEIQWAVNVAWGPRENVGTPVSAKVWDSVLQLQGIWACIKGMPETETKQADWKDDTDDESEDQELEAHYMYMAQYSRGYSRSVDYSVTNFDDEPMLSAKVKIKNNNLSQRKSVQTVFLKEREQYFEIQDLKAQLLDKGIAIRVIPNTSVSRPQLKSNHLEDRVMSNNSQGKKQEVEDQLGSFNWWYPKYTPPGYNWKPKSQKGNVNTKISIASSSSRSFYFIVDSGCSKHMTKNLKISTNFVEKFLGTVKFGNDQIAPILGYGDLVQGTITIKRVYYVEGLNHNLFSVGQFCDADLEVAFRKSTCYIRDLKGNDLSQVMAFEIFSHLNFDTINLLSKNNIVNGLSKLKFVKDHLCSSCLEKLRYGVLTEVNTVYWEFLGVGTTNRYAVSSLMDTSYWLSEHVWYCLPSPRCLLCKYKLEVVVADDTAHTVVVMFNDTTTELLKCSAESLLGAGENEDGESSFPTAIRNLIGTTHVLEIKSHTYYKYGTFESFTCWKFNPSEMVDDGASSSTQPMSVDNLNSINEMIV
ncbi:retrovirus-related pol polyprotein from transposon TNT 1-94 [Tanacetum coccineum]